MWISAILCITADGRMSKCVWWGKERNLQITNFGTSVDERSGMRQWMHGVMEPSYMHKWNDRTARVCVCAGGWAGDRKSTWILWNAIGVKTAGCAYQQSIYSYIYAPRHWPMSGDHQVTTTGTWNYWKLRDHMKRVHLGLCTNKSCH